MIDSEKLDLLLNKMTSIESKMTSIEIEMLSIKLTLENETNRIITIIAEGHLDLSRKLDDALKVETEKEMLLIRMNKVENEIKLIKEKLSKIS